MMEILNDAHPKGPFRAALLDFDGTLSLLRRGWQQVMIPMAVEHLAATTTSESKAQLQTIVEEFVTRLTGKQTIFQMIRLAAEIKKRGGTALEPIEYKREYHDRLWQSVSERIEAVKSGEIPAEEMTVPGADPLLRHLTDCGVDCFLASGTDEPYVRDEVALLQLEHYFNGQIYGARDDYENFSKAAVIAQIIGETGVAGPSIIGIGDGYVEIEEIKKVGGLALGVASNEFERNGIDTWKRQRLVDAGADIIVSDFREFGAVCEQINLVAVK